MVSKHYFTNHQCCVRYIAPEFYARPLSQEEAIEVLRGLLRRWDRLMREVGVEYWLIAGSLLGAHRNGSIIPYDDDLDVAVNVNQMPLLMDLAGTTPVTDANEDWIPVYETSEDVLRISPHWERLVHEREPKYWVDGKFVDKAHGLWVDILAHHELPDHSIASKFPTGRPLPRYRRSWLFPLRRIRFEGLTTRAPHLTGDVLEARYGPGFATPDHVYRDGQWFKAHSSTPG